MGEHMQNGPKTRITSQSDAASISTELASRRTGMSFLRTSLSLIGFGFTINQVFQKLHESDVLKSSAAATHFGVALVLLGIAMLLVGIAYHASFMVGLRRERAAMKADGLVHAESHFPVSLTLVVALLLLAIGLLVIVSMAFHVGPFG